MHTSRFRASPDSQVGEAPDLPKKEKKEIPIGLAAEEALGLDEGILQFFPPASKMSYGPRVPWRSSSNRSDGETKRPKPVVRLGVL